MANIFRKIFGKQIPEIPIPFSKRRTFDAEREINRLYNVLMGVVIVVIISFIAAFFIMIQEKVNDNALYLKYDNLYENCSKQNSELEKLINQQQIRISNLENNLKNFKTNYPGFRF